MTIEPRLRRISTNGITLNVAEAGPEEGPLVILLHGFPEGWTGWKHQIGPIAGAGYHVLALDQRGYGESDKPRGVASYRLETLVDDVLGLVDGSGRDRASIIGHDWGGIVTFAAIARHPERFDRAVIINAPHPETVFRELRANPRQLLKSWYVFSFQLPLIPEMLFRARDFRLITRGLTRSSRPGAFTPGDLEEFKKAWSQPQAVTSMIHWYRAAFRHPPAPSVDPLIRIPTLILWGAKDQFLGRGLARTSYAHCEDARLEWFENATHWLPHEEPEAVNRSILEFLRSPGPLDDQNSPTDPSVG